MKLRLGVLISGRGSNLAALIDACKKPYFPAEIVVVISDKKDAPGLKLAEAAGIPTVVVPHPSRCGFAIGAGWPLVQNKVDLIVLAGFMRVLHQGFVMRWEKRIINIHPSILPSFPGLHPQRKALDARCLTSGCTVHWVVPEVDAGPIIAQAVVNIAPTDDEDALSARILTAEHQLYPMAINMIANQMLKNSTVQNTS
jgi:phosphoribosylglycinamide formyltransferase 1